MQTSVRKTKHNLEKYSYSYVIVQRGKREENNGVGLSRVMKTPDRLKRAVRLQLCTFKGELKQDLILKDEKSDEVYRNAKNVKSGSLWEECDN
jgi:ribosomal protein RSM22 (predicted rRNA methylase)